MSVQPPQADDAEYRLIAALSLYPDLLGGVQIDPASFRMGEARAAWDKMQEAVRASRPIIQEDYRMFQARAGIDNIVPIPAYLAEDARRIARAYRRRCALAKAQQIAQAAYGADDAALNSALGSAAEISAPSAGTLRRVDALNTLGRYGDPNALKALMLRTGLERWDRSIGGGLELNTSTLLGARPSMGKTAAMVQVSDLASEDKKIVAVFSKEMTAEQWHFRMACRRARVSYKGYLEGTISEDEEVRVLDWVVKIQAERTTLFIDDSAPQDTAAVEAECLRIKNEFGRIDLILADHIRLFSDKAQSENKRLGDISWAFKAMVKPNRLNSRALVAVQLSRDIERRGGDSKRPDLQDLRDSGELEENADNVVMLYRESYYTENSSDKTAELINRKCRNGERNSRAVFVFVPEYMSFEPMADKPRL